MAKRITVSSSPSAGDLNKAVRGGSLNTFASRFRKVAINNRATLFHTREWMSPVGTIL
jgi:hypothetical protein